MRFYNLKIYGKTNYYVGQYLKIIQENYSLLFLIIYIEYNV